MDKFAEQLINKLIKSKVDIINTPKDLLLDFLFSNGVPKSHLETVYQVLLNGTSGTSGVSGTSGTSGINGATGSNGTSGTRSDNPVINPVINNKEVKGRKDVFGEIKRIA